MPPARATLPITADQPGHVVPRELEGVVVAGNRTFATMPAGAVVSLRFG